MKDKTALALIVLLIPAAIVLGYLVSVLLVWLILFILAKIGFVFSISIWWGGALLFVVSFVIKQLKN